MLAMFSGCQFRIAAGLLKIDNMNYELAKDYIIQRCNRTVEAITQFIADYVFTTVEQTIAKILSVKEYEHKRENFWQLCKPCHSRKDKWSRNTIPNHMDTVC